MTYFTEYRVEDAGQPFRDGRDDDYSCFGPFCNDIGIYVFQHRDTGGVLYVGESHTISHPLKERIGQHYTPGNRGGNFRIDWCKENCRLEGCGDRNCSNACNPSFMHFKCLIRRSRIIVFSFDPDNDNENAADKVFALESALIRRLRPTYDSGELLARQINPECVERAIACIPVRSLEE